jgi:ammonium transporter, Amt family
VAVTAPCAFIQPWAAMVIGIIAGILVIFAARFIERRGVDDPVGAVAVHGVCGTFGVLAVGIFADGQYGQGWNGTEGASATQGVTGFLYGGDGWAQFLTQAIAAVVIWTVIFGIAFAFFKLQNTFMKGGIRPPAEEELMGMDLPEMGALAYPEFVHHEQLGSGPGGSAFSEAPAPKVPVGDGTST